MAVTTNTLGNGETVATAQGNYDPSTGAAGINSQVPGTPTTVSATASATGGINGGNLVEVDIDEQLFRFNSDDTPLMNLMLKAKKVKVNSPEVDHYMIDEPRCVVTTSAALTGGSGIMQAALPLGANDMNIPRPYGTLLVEGVDGYDETGQTQTPGKPLMLFVTGNDTTSGQPIVRAVNGQKSNASDEYSYLPNIPAGTKCVVLSNALYETQKEVEPDLIVPQPTRIYLQKRGMNQIVSDYFESQKKRIPFTEALIAEQAISNFKVRGNRTLWSGRKGKMKVNVPKMGMQYVYYTEGIRWQFKRELQHTGDWTFEKLIALAKMFFTGEDVPKSALLLAGKNLLEEIQCINFSKHPEVTIDVTTNKLGWSITRIHTVFGDIDIKREPTLDRLGWSNSGALLGEDRLVHYQRTAEHSFNEKIEGEEAKRSGILVWDALALKGSCHIWIDGESNGKTTTGAVNFVMWESNTAPTGSDLVNGVVYYFMQDTTLGSGASAITAQNGTMWKYDSTNGWSEYSGEISL